MPGNKLIIEFNQDIVIGTNLNISSDMFNNIWSFATLRTAQYQVTTGEPTLTPGERAAMNFQQAFNLDKNATNGYQVNRYGNVLMIVAINGNIFNDAYVFNSNAPGEPIDVNFIYQNAVYTPPFSVTSIEYLQSANVLDRCNKVRVKITTNIEISSISSPVNSTGINDTVFTFSYPRGITGNINVTSNQAQPVTINQGFQAPSILSENNQVVNINNSPNGATLILTSVNQQGLTLTYALSPPNTSPTASSYQSGNVFSGIAPGDYWIYFKDQFGCVKYKAITVPEHGDSRTPFFFISKAMSFRFANRVNFSDAGNYKTDENTLSCESDVLIPYKEVQQFQTADVITTQFKSNYSVNTATIIKENGDEVAAPVILKSNNIGVKDKRDAIKVNLGNGKTGIYFVSGNIYDYDTDAVTETYALNGTLPYWVTFGNYFNVNNEWFQVDEVYYDENLFADVIVIDAVYTGSPVNVIVGSIFNLFNYEVYEFTIDLVDYQNQNIQVRIDSNDVEFTSIQHLSEIINVQVKQEKTVEIKYSNPENTDVFYSTGITNLIRQRLTKKTAFPIESSENYKTDSTTILLNAEVYEGVRFRFEPVTTEIMRKMVQAFNHKNLQIDGVYYVKNGECEIEGPIEETNIYVVTANLIKTAGAFNNNLAGSDNELFDTTNLEIPGLIDQGDGSYIKY